MVRTSFLLMVAALTCLAFAGEASAEIPGVALPSDIEVECPTCIDPCADPAEILSNGVREYLNECLRIQ